MGICGSCPVVRARPQADTSCPVQGKELARIAAQRLSADALPSGEVAFPPGTIKRAEGWRWSDGKRVPTSDLACAPRSWAPARRGDADAVRPETSHRSAVIRAPPTGNTQGCKGLVSCCWAMVRRRGGAGAPGGTQLHSSLDTQSHILPIFWYRVRPTGWMRCRRDSTARRCPLSLAPLGHHAY